MADIAARFPTTLFAAEGKGSGNRPADNDRVVMAAQALAPGEVHVFFQVRLDAMLDGWHVRGDVDILRLERARDGIWQVLIADMKSSASAKVEHRLQVAFYAEMLDTTLHRGTRRACTDPLAVLYRGSSVDGGSGGTRRGASRGGSRCSGPRCGYLETGRRRGGLSPHPCAISSRPLIPPRHGSWRRRSTNSRPTSTTSATAVCTTNSA